MATVYLAQDLRHDRKVALKVLRPDLAAVIGAERFLQEIKTTANLQHPHILALFDSGQVATTDPASGDTARTVFYVMPFVEGESLRDRLTREKQLPVADAVRIAGEVASALDYAHRRGVIHRDIKPENILLHDAQALVADFGIALAASRSEGGSRMTETGMSLGTPHYMSPEQAMGERTLDARTDVYALGCVLYEMLTGEPPFTGPTAQAIVARVMTEVPRSVTLQRKSVPPHVEAAVLTALEKLPADRFATAAEFLAALGDTARRPTGGGAMAAVPSRLRAFPWVLAAFGLVLGAVSIWRNRQGPAPSAIRFSITPPTGEEIAAGGGLSLTPDGRTLVFVSSRNGVSSLVRRNLDDPAFHRLEGTDGAQEPALSPDGRWVAFAASDGRIKKLALEGGRPIALITTGVPAGMQWSGRYGLLLGMPVFSPTTRGLSLLATDGDTILRPITTPDRGMHHSPALLADDETALFQDIGFGRKGGLGVVSLKTGDTSRVDLQLGEPLGIAAGTLLYLGTDNQLYAVPFDAKQNRISGTPVRLTEEGIQVERAALARDGTLAMAVAPQVLEVVLVDEQGRAEPVYSEPTTRLIPRFSPDGRRIAMSADFRGTPSAWVLNLADRTLVKLGFPHMPSSLNWTADGGRVIGTSLTSWVYWQPADAGDTVSVLLRVAGRQVVAASLAPDQRTLALAAGQELSRFDIVSRSVQGDTTVFSLAASAANEVSPRFSPDGKWLAYASDESGRYEVFARPVPGPGSRVQLSDAGGTEPVWSRDGRRLFYRVGRSMMAVDLTPGTVLTVAGRQRLFEGDFQSSADFGFPVQTYDVSPDGRRFVMARASGGTRAEIVIWTNWLRELKTRMANAR
jgi:serine/threonine protein kinase